MALSLTTEQKQNGLWVGLAVALLGLLYLLGPILAPFIAAGMLAYALNPGVDWLASRRIGPLPVPRALAVSVMICVLIALLLGMVVIVIPVVQQQIPLLQVQIPNALTKLNVVLGPRLNDLGLNVQIDVSGIKRILTEHLATSGEAILAAVLASARVGGTALLGWLTTLVLVPMVLFYMLMDWHAMLQKLQNLVPRRLLDKTVAMAREVDGLLAQYLRGQLLVMLVLAIYYSAALALAGLHVALPVGILTGLLAFVPYVGFGLGLVLALLSAFLQFDGMQGLLAIALIYGVGQVLEGFVLTPRLVGERIGLHPLVVIFALLAFGQLFGFVGFLLALPASAVTSVATRHLRVHYLNSSFYQNT